MPVPPLALIPVPPVLLPPVPVPPVLLPPLLEPPLAPVLLPPLALAPPVAPVPVPPFEDEDPLVPLLLEPLEPLVSSTMPLGASEHALATKIIVKRLDGRATSRKRVGKGCIPKNSDFFRRSSQRLETARRIARSRSRASS
jgi:hypothetical protein